MAAEMRLPPEPKMDVNYQVKIDFSNPIGTALNVGSNIAKAANANRVDSLMRDALQVVDVPGMVRDESYSTSLTVLGAQEEEDPLAADYLLDFDIHKWGIDAGSWTSAVSLRMKLTAILYSNAEKTIVWRRDIEVERDATPEMFGLDSTIGNFVTTAALASLSEEDLQNGFDQLALVHGSHHLADPSERPVRRALRKLTAGRLFRQCGTCFSSCNRGTHWLSGYRFRRASSIRAAASLSPTRSASPGRVEHALG